MPEGWQCATSIVIALLLLIWLELSGIQRGVERIADAIEDHVYDEETDEDAEGEAGEEETVS